MKRRIGILRKRSETDAKRFIQIVTGENPATDVMVFRFSDEIWSVSINYIVQVLRVEKVTFFSDISEISFVHGYIFFRQEVIPVIGLHKLLGLPQISEFGKRTMVLVCKVNDYTFGLIADEVLEAIPIGKEEMAKFPHELLKKHTKLISTAHAWRNKVGILLDISSLLGKEDIQILKEEGERIKEEYGI